MPFSPYLEFGFQSSWRQRWDIQKFMFIVEYECHWGVHCRGATPAWGHQICILLQQRWLLEEECQIITWDCSAVVVLSNRWKRARNLPTNPSHYYWWLHGIHEKGPLKKLDPPVKIFYDFATRMVSKLKLGTTVSLWWNLHHFQHSQQAQLWP